jgi:phosphatidylglycerophosphate synthase
MVSMDPKHAPAAALGTQGPADHWPAGVVQVPRRVVDEAARAIHTGPVAGMIAQAALLVVLAGTVGLSGVGWVVGLTCAAIMNAALALGLSRYRSDSLGLADWVTLARGTLAVAVAALVADSFAQRAPVAMLVALAAMALALDAVDGWVARRTRTTAALGAQFDGEVDAFLILVLSVYVASSAGAWVLTIGAARYAFLAAGWGLPWLRQPLPPRYWRKFVAATQGIVLTVVAANILPPALTTGALVVALVLLAESFGHDIWWLRGNRQGAQPGIATGPGPAPDDETGAPVGPGPVRRGIAVGLTILAAVLVWAALVAPDQPKYLTPSAFVRIPLEGLVLVALALVLPLTARRILAGVVGPALALVVILKVLDIGFFTTFDRPFDPLGDTSDAGIGLETLRAAIGRTEANLVVVGAIVGVVALVLLTTFAAFRLTRVAAGNRRWAWRTVAGLGAAWGICWLFGAQLISHTPLASTLSAGLVVDEVRTLQADIHDQSVFANQIKHDSFRNTPGGKLLTGLRGKDVLLVFVESYGRVTVQGSTFSPAVDALLDRGTTRLRAAGFAARSGFLTSSTFGGISWLAHSSLQAGVWANTQQRYNQLVSTDRFTLSDAFNRAGWRTVDMAPADDRPWPEGLSFYHYDKLYDRRDIGYRGPTFTYAPMPDQYMFLALHRLELARSHRRPVFAEVDTVSSHMPWNRIPAQISWADVGNGSIYNRIPMDHETGAFWSNPTRVRAAYSRSIEYSLSTLISFVQHYGNKNLVLAVVGDEQPLPIVSGETANHDVPISIVAHDPKVLKQIGSWGWGPGLRPRANAPVWPMSAFRNRFLSAFDSHPANR